MRFLSRLPRYNQLLVSLVLFPANVAGMMMIAQQDISPGHRFRMTGGLASASASAAQHSARASDLRLVSSGCCLGLKGTNGALLSGLIMRAAYALEPNRIPPPIRAEVRFLPRLRAVGAEDIVSRCTGTRTQLDPVVHGRDPRAAQRTPPVLRSGAREVPVDPPGRASRQAAYGAASRRSRAPTR
jgi:hypothetical protein